MTNRGKNCHAFGKETKETHHVNTMQLFCKQKQFFNFLQVVFDAVTKLLLKLQAQCSINIKKQRGSTPTAPLLIL